MDDGAAKKEKYFMLNLEYVEILIEECERDTERVKSLLKQYAQEDSDAPLFLLLCEYYSAVHNLEIVLKNKLKEEQHKDTKSQVSGYAMLEEKEVTALNTLNLLLTGYEMRLKNYNISFLTH